MKPMTIYVADDGSRHDTEAACAAYEALCREVDAVMAGLRPRPNDDGCRFSNGHGFLQHSREAFLSAQCALVKIARRSFADGLHAAHFDHAEAATHPVGLAFVSRLISEGCPYPLDRAWHRLCCTDNEFREWGQPYYAINPSQGERVPL